MTATFANDRYAVIGLANKLRTSMEDASKAAVATAALRQHYGLCKGDGIWGGSPAATLMGFRGHPESQDLLEMIADDIAEYMP